MQELSNVQQQMLQLLQNIDSQFRNVLYVLEQQPQRDSPSCIQPSTPGLSTQTCNSGPTPASLTPTSICAATSPTMPTQITVTSGSISTLPAASNPTPSNAALEVDPLMDGISKEKLLPPSVVINKYPRLRGDSKMGELAAKLARECFFGKDLMRQSTVMGFKDFPALPANGVQALKQTILSVCPDYHCNPHGFESVWRKCIDAFNHACSKLRK